MLIGLLKGNIVPVRKPVFASYAKIGKDEKNSFI